MKGIPWTAALEAQLIAAGATVTPVHVQALTGESREPVVERGKVELVEASFTPPGTWVVPLRVYAGDNLSGSKNKSRIGRAGHERRKVAHELSRRLVSLFRFADAIQNGRPVRATLTRLGGNKMDYANVVSAMKYVQDTVALFCGVDDGSPLWLWEYKAETGGPYGVRITLEAA